MKGEVRRYGHVVVDEAQDLSPMELRMLARRAVASSITVLGDLAQATGAGASRSWTDALEHLGSPEAVRTAELTIGYRLPAAILDSRTACCPRPRRTSRRRSRRARRAIRPSCTRSPRPRSPRPSSAQAAALADEFATIAVIAPVAMLDELRAELAAAGIDVPLPEHSTIAHRLSLLPAALAKGLEFDAVVVVEPAAIVARVGARRAPALRRAHPTGAAPRDRPRAPAAAGARANLPDVGIRSARSRRARRARGTARAG